MKYEGKKVYICEDDSDIRDLLKDVTEELKFEVSTFENGRYCLDKINTLLPDLIISDINMPEMDGVNLLKHLFKSELKIPVIFITGDADPNHYLNAVAYNHFDFLYKPLTIDQLHEAIHKSMIFGYQTSSNDHISEKIRKRINENHD